MSDHNTQTTAGHKGAKGAATAAAAAQTNDHEGAAAERTIVLEIAGLQVTLPVKFRPGHVLTDAQSRILDAAYQRQFTNNQNAIAKGKVDAIARAGAAITADQAAKYAPLTATDLAALYMTYEPNVGNSAPRQSALEALRQEKAWSFWTAEIAEHNTQVRAGGQGIIAKAPGKLAGLDARPRKAKGADDAAHAAAVAAYEAKRTKIIAQLLGHSAYGPRIEAVVQAELAARAAAKAVEAPQAAETEVVEDLF